MSMQTSDKREHVFKILFMDGFHEPEEMEAVIDNYFDCLKFYEPGEEEERGVMPNERDMASIKEKYYAIRDSYDRIDSFLNNVSDGWHTSRMAPVDLSILRLAVYEMEYEKAVPVGVSINEAVEFGKYYGGSGSYSFINGILGKLARENK